MPALLSRSILRLHYIQCSVHLQHSAKASPVVWLPKPQTGLAQEDAPMKVVCLIALFCTRKRFPARLLNFCAKKGRDGADTGGNRHRRTLAATTTTEGRPHYNSSRIRPSTQYFRMRPAAGFWRGIASTKKGPRLGGLAYSNPSLRSHDGCPCLHMPSGSTMHPSVASTMESKSISSSSSSVGSSVVGSGNLRDRILSSCVIRITPPLNLTCPSSQFAKKTVAPEKGPQSTLYGLTVHGHLSGSAAAQLPQQRQRFLVHVGVIVLACVVGRIPHLDRRLDIRTQEHERYGLVLVLDRTLNVIVVACRKSLRQSRHHVVDCDLLRSQRNPLRAWFCLLDREPRHRFPRPFVQHSDVGTLVPASPRADYASHDQLRNRACGDGRGKVARSSELDHRRPAAIGQRFS